MSFFFTWQGKTPCPVSISVSPPVHLPFCLDLSSSLQVPRMKWCFQLTPSELLKDFSNCPVFFLAPISSFPWNLNMTDILIPLKKIFLDTIFLSSLSLLQFSASLQRKTPYKRCLSLPLPLVPILLFLHPLLFGLHPYSSAEMASTVATNWLQVTKQ